MQQLIRDVIQFEKQLELHRQDLAINPNFSMDYFPEHVTLIDLRELFGIDVVHFFRRYDTDRDGKLTAADLQQFVAPRQAEYSNFAKAQDSHYGAVRGLIELSNKYEQYMSKQLNLMIDEQAMEMSIIKYISHQFYRCTEKDIWYINNRVPCITVGEFIMGVMGNVI